MQKLLFSLFTICFLLALSGCLLNTFHPIFTEKDVVYKEELAGTWNTLKKDGAARVEIVPLSSVKDPDLPGKTAGLKNKGYLIRYKNMAGETSSEYIAFLAKIGKYYYFDYYPSETEKEKQMDEFYRMHVTKMHTAYRVDFLPDGSFNLRQLNQDLLEKLIKEKKVSLRHEVVNESEYVITASTEELQQYILKYADTDEAYSQDDITRFTKITKN